MARKAGVVSEETRTRLLQAAAQEFYARGFSGSSLRQICQNAQVTTGALYFFFDGKDDLFEAVISAVTVPIRQALTAHYASEQDVMNSPSFHPIPDIDTFVEEFINKEDDLEVFKSIIHGYFKNQMLFDIVLKNQSHPAVAEFMGEITAMTEAQMAKLFELIHFLYPQREPLDPFGVHWLARLQIESVLGMISSGFTEEEAIFHAKTVLKILKGGFLNLL